MATVIERIVCGTSLDALGGSLAAAEELGLVGNRIEGRL